MQAFQFRDMKWSLWDRWVLQGDLTVQQVLDWFKVSLHSNFSKLISTAYLSAIHNGLQVPLILWVLQARGLEAYSISCGQSLLYNNIFPKHKDRLSQRMSTLVRTVAKTDIPSHRSHFDVVVACEDEDGEDMDVPLVSIKFRD